MIEKVDIRCVGVVGEGKMGSGIFHLLLDFPFQIAWLCSREADVDKLHRQYIKKINRGLEAGIYSREQHEIHLQTRISGDPAILADCDLVIEAIPESAVLKKELFQVLDEVVRPGAIFTSNSSSINPSALSPSGARAERFAGLHFFYPVALKNIVELTQSPATSDETLQLLEHFLDITGRRYIVLDEKNSFLLNRIFLDVQNEAFRLVKDGHCSYAQVDLAVKTQLFSFGIFDFCDSVGNDIMLAAVRNYIQDYPHADYFSGFTGALEDLVSRGRIGMKRGAGFYDYPAVTEDPPLPGLPVQLTEHLRQTWLASCRRLTALSHLPLHEANEAIKEYFGVQTGPFG